MEITFIYVLGAVAITSLISLLGVLYFVFSKDVLTKLLPWLVAFAAGALLGTSFFDLIPESFAVLGERASIYIVIGIMVFLVFEQVLHWHHERYHQCADCNTKAVVGYSVLLGDSLHNFLDGILIASAFLTSIPIGISVTIAVILHEIPQELGDFAVLIHSGFNRTKALLFNFISALAALVGGVLGYFFLQKIEHIIPYVVAIGAGGLLYIALVDLFAELKTHKSFLVRFGQVVVVILGLLVLWLVSRNYI